MNLLIVEPGEMTRSGDVMLTDGRSAHLRTVLKVALGQTVRVGLLDGPFGVGVVTAVGDDGVGLRCSFEPAAPPLPRVDLMLALPRPKVLRRLWAQVAALGVGRIILTNAARVERNYFDTHVLTPACYRPLLLEGLQQARDTRLPAVSVHRQFRRLIEDELDGLSDATLRLVAHPTAAAAAAVLARERPDGRILLAVGPEGGWNDYELTLLQHHGFTRVGMGARTLRTDTACIALLSLVHDAGEVG
jgi:16S rRNA (uracil1498-N3)-methyltransferase